MILHKQAPLLRHRPQRDHSAYAFQVVSSQDRVAPSPTYNRSDFHAWARGNASFMNRARLPARAV